MILEYNIQLPSLVTYPTIQRYIKGVNLYVADDVIINIYTEYFLDGNLFSSGFKYRLETNNSEIKVDNSGNFVYKHLMPAEAVSVKYTSWSEYCPVDANGLELDFVKDANGEYVENPAFATAITENDFYKYMSTQPIAISVLIENVINKFIQAGRFKYEQK